jgi:hypothetical protein
MLKSNEKYYSFAQHGNRISERKIEEEFVAA